MAFLSSSQRLSMWWSLSSKVGKDNYEDEAWHVADKPNPAEFLWQLFCWIHQFEEKPMPIMQKGSHKQLQVNNLRKLTLFSWLCLFTGYTRIQGSHSSGEKTTRSFCFFLSEKHVQWLNEASRVGHLNMGPVLPCRVQRMENLLQSQWSYSKSEGTVFKICILYPERCQI